MELCQLTVQPYSVSIRVLATGEHVPILSFSNRQKWYNELDFEMEITSVDTATGVFGGRYLYTAGEAAYWYIRAHR